MRSLCRPEAVTLTPFALFPCGVDTTPDSTPQLYSAALTMAEQSHAPPELYDIGQQTGILAFQEPIVMTWWERRAPYWAAR